MIFALDKGGTRAPVLAVNAAFCDLFGVHKEKLLGRSLPDNGIVLPATSREDLFMPVVEGGAVKNREIRIWRPDGRGVTLLVSVQPLEFQGRRSELATAIDVSDLHERERRLAGVLDSTLDPAITIDHRAAHRDLQRGCRAHVRLCTEGMPAAAQRVLLHQLRASGAVVAYHGDFDWPGIRIAGHVIRMHGAMPWRMGSSDYEQAVECAPTARKLSGHACETEWDSRLSETMAETGVAVAEEAITQLLLPDLGGGA